MPVLKADMGTDNVDYDKIGLVEMTDLSDDAKSELGVPAGTYGQTLRYNSSEELEANSRILNSDTNIKIDAGTNPNQCSFEVSENGNGVYSEIRNYDGNTYNSNAVILWAGTNPYTSIVEAYLMLKTDDLRIVDTAGVSFGDVGQFLKLVNTDGKVGWADASFIDGSIDGSVLRWNDTSKVWEETSFIKIFESGVVRLSNLAGTGYRQLFASPNGNLTVNPYPSLSIIKAEQEIAAATAPLYDEFINDNEIQFSYGGGQTWEFDIYYRLEFVLNAITDPVYYCPKVLNNTGLGKFHLSFNTAIDSNTDVTQTFPPELDYEFNAMGTQLEMEFATTGSLDPINIECHITGNFSSPVGESGDFMLSHNFKNYINPDSTCRILASPSGCLGFGLFKRII